MGTVYLAFPSKYDLFKALYATVQQQRQAELAARLDWSDPRAAIRQMITENIAAMNDNAILAEWSSEKPGAQLRADLSNNDALHFGEMFAQWKARGLVAPDVDAALFAELLEIARVTDKEQLARPSTFQFLVEAVVDKLFPQM